MRVGPAMDKGDVAICPVCDMNRFMTIVDGLPERQEPATSGISEDRVLPVIRK